MKRENAAAAAGHDDATTKKPKPDDKDEGEVEEGELEEGEIEEGEVEEGFKARASMAWVLDLKKPPKHRIIRSPLRFACEKGKPITGLWLEFGVFSGKTINLMSEFIPRGQHVYGFDTFTGLPEAWRGKFPKGQFDMKGKFPPVNSNVRLIKGLFQDTLDPFLKEHTKKDEMTVAVAHLDADLYSATIDVLDLLAPRIVPNTLLVFDELINYEGFEEHEWKALLEAVEKYGWTFEWIAQSGPLEDPVVYEVWETQQVAIRILTVGNTVK